MIMKDPNRAIECCRQRLCASWTLNDALEATWVPTRTSVKTSHCLKPAAVVVVSRVAVQSPDSRGAAGTTRARGSITSACRTQENKSSWIIAHSADSLLICCKYGEKLSYFPLKVVASVLLGSVWSRVRV